MDQPAAGKARVILTLACGRRCDGCRNNGPVFEGRREIADISEVLGYPMIMLTGGEPMLYPAQTLDVARRVRRESGATLYLYSSLFRRADEDVWADLLPLLDGLQFTLHAEADAQDVADMAAMSAFVASARKPGQSLRLSIDHRLYADHDFSKIDLSGWDSVRRLVWLTDCPLPAGEDLLLLRARPGEWTGPDAAGHARTAALPGPADDGRLPTGGPTVARAQRSGPRCLARSRSW